MSWPPSLPVVQVRIARPTNQLEEVVRFYHDGLGLPVLGGFEDHDGYSGVMLGLPDRTYHLEFTTRRGGSPCPAPTPDHLLVLYVPDPRAIEEQVARLAAMGYQTIEPLNPYWARGGVTVLDPDGWRIVLMSQLAHET
jgi:catechol 2,3-dioxygenase-like lactoylglutathione lyase family enzyme